MKISKESHKRTAVAVMEDRVGGVVYVPGGSGIDLSNNLKKEVWIQKVCTTFSIRYRQEQLLRNMSGKIIYQRLRTRSEKHRK